ncbi:hypothetical protein B0J14DRAFT_660071 [Halenospora varia]|nr:hypothetical protein B0J14DRAFT_660071 [Halenospora varia]
MSWCPNLFRRDKSGTRTEEREHPAVYPNTKTPHEDAETSENDNSATQNSLGEATHTRSCELLQPPTSSTNTSSQPPTSSPMTEPMQHLAPTSSASHSYESLLQTQLIESFAKNCFQAEQEFLPADMLDGLVTESNIDNVLSEAGVMSPDIKDYIGKSARKTFATLVCIGKTSAVQDFHCAGFTDEDLPVEERSEMQEGHTGLIWVVKSCYAAPATLQSPSDIKHWAMFSEWTAKSIREFSRDQWLFLAPVFSSTPFEYKLHHRCPLPFPLLKRTLTNSFFSNVYEVEVHPAHMKVDESDNQEAPRMIAVKQLRQDNQDKTDRYAKEFEVLDIIRKINHPHLINALAAYTWGEDRCFIFPWAEGGNLREFWKDHPLSEGPRSHDLISWLLEQFHGLFEGLRTLHYWEKTKNCRHGDLKPENILLFTRSNGKRLPGRGRLVVADVGLTKFHNVPTKLRKEATGTWTGTQKYEPPETDLERGDTGQPRSRLYDMWSMGCISLECIIWLLYGPNELERFNQIDKFWHIRNGNYEVHTTVEKWMKHIAKDPRCSITANINSSTPRAPRAKDYLNGTGGKSFKQTAISKTSGTAIKDLLDLVQKRLLVVKTKSLDPLQEEDRDPTYRAYSKESESYLKDILTKREQVPDYLCQQAIWNERKNASGLPRTSKLLSGRNLDVERPHHQSLPSIPDIDHELDGNTDYGFPDIQIEQVDVKDFGNSISARESNEGGEYVSAQPSPSLPFETPLIGFFFLGQNFLHTLNDKWDYELDNTFAREFIARIDQSYLFPDDKTPSLCDHCTGMDIWSSGFQREDNVSALEERALTCNLCKMLEGCLTRSSTALLETARFYRVGSSLRMNHGSSPMLSLYIRPESRKAPPSAQIGLPRLPSRGTRAHLDLLRRWLKVCDENHKQCRPRTGFLPTRIIDVGHDTTDASIKLCTTIGAQVEKYAALSHCWGAQTTWQHHSLSTSNIKALHHKINFGRLPKTFQDAITVTRALGIRYLWIDSLCIIQDSKSDWAAEATLMEDVFSSACCTIAASSANSSDGFLGSRSTRNFVTIPTASDGPYYICDTIDDFRTDVEEGLLNRRGWVLQERALSPRTIHFTSNQAYWECGEGIRSETLSKLRNSKAAFLGDPQFPKSSLKYLKGGRIRLFEILYERYSSLAFTYMTDRAVAIIGLEKRLLTTFDTKGGFGALDLYLHRSLLWKGPDTLRMKRLVYPADQSVPSWSWMAVDGPISYLEVPLGKADWNDKLKSPFKSAKDISANYWQIGKGHPRLELKAEARKFVLARTNTLKRLITFDIEPSVGLEDMRCVVVGKQKLVSSHDLQKHYVLAVVPLHSEGPGIFERAGVGTVDKKLISFEEPAESVSII